MGPIDCAQRSELRLVRHFRPGGGLFGNGHKVWGFSLFLGGWVHTSMLLGATGHEAKGFQRSDINAAVFLTNQGIGANHMVG